MLCLLIGMSCAVRSQTIDTLCFTIPQVQKLLIAGQQKKAQDTLIALLNNDIRGYESIVRTFQQKDSVNAVIIGAMTEQRKVFEGQITYLNKEVKKWKRKTTWTAIGGVLLTGITSFIILTR